jgi:DNA-binding GntR family transcriptional regulator
MPVSRRQRGSEPAPHGERVDQTYERLRELIVRNRLKPGTRVGEAALALRFGVSRTPIRAALDRLALERFLVPSSAGLRVALVVAPLTDADVHELWMLMGALEGAAVLGLHELGRNALRRLSEAMRATNEELTAVSRRRVRDTDRIGELMAQFHVLFMDACAGPRLRALHESVLPHVQRYEWAYDDLHDYEPSVTEHRAICDAVESGAPGPTRRLIEQHWTDGMRRRLAQMQRRGAR